MKKLIKELSDMRGISGFEYRITDRIAQLFYEYADEVTVDSLGSIIAVKRCGREGAPKLMIEAHCDEIGLMVTDIDERGFITFANIGGVDQRILPAAEVVVHGRVDLPGIIGAKPPHLQSADEGKKSAKIKDMAIDVGMNRTELNDLVSVGDSITLAQSSGELLNGRFSGKTLDDRAGVAVLLEVIKKLGKIDADVYFVAAVQEEVGLRGARAAAYGINPDLAIAIDVCHAVTPDNSENAFETGSGVVISRGPNIHPMLEKRLSEIAKAHKIKHEIDVDGGDTGTDAWAIQVTQNGVPTALLSLPLKYMHTSVETLDLADAKACAALLTAFLKEFDSRLEDWLCF